MDQLILVDKNDNEIGSKEKEECHRSPMKLKDDSSARRLPLHRAFSIFIFNSSGKLLVHKRSSLKKTWPGFWTNSCCSHPRKGEKIEQAVKRRLKEELGFTCTLRFLFKFEYQSRYDDTWGEHELDHVFIGKYDGTVKPNKDEVDDWKFIDTNELKRDISKNPKKYTPWFKLCLDKVLQNYR